MARANLTHFAIVILLVVLVNADFVWRAELGAFVRVDSKNRKAGPAQVDVLERQNRMESCEEQALPEKNAEALDCTPVAFWRRRQRIHPACRPCNEPVEEPMSTPDRRPAERGWEACWRRPPNH